MNAAYVTLTVIASVFTGSAAIFYLIGHKYPQAQLEMKKLPPYWMSRLGGILAAGALGLLMGFVVPAVGTLAAVGLILYFILAIGAHLRVGSRNIIGAIVFLTTLVAQLVVAVADHRPW
ncbi:hypothetical protein Aab01nite_72760 [Paractinoplanes abujensis]|uniref:Phage shock protein PspC (Stress-responsive transcriptional regulator) n=1 Tax=Paractinoplanes abujensis TaxID=882441 RepID=A0A7W7CWX0_9ACTN|nr:DoxX family protein [Actinoplanes abujensis]MBB4694955.1 phage shock protein PspC (stress-responsive transcriptional regulator) [Actinoplanes abujensis]GID23686.1 hypothetical protein Aab01nite_72760 [Actinoplanes abujensis]